MCKVTLIRFMYKIIATNVYISSYVHHRDNCCDFDIVVLFFFLFSADYHFVF